MKQVVFALAAAGVWGAASAVPVPTFDARLTAHSPDCTYVDYYKRTPQTFSEVDGRSIVTFGYLKRDDPKFYDTMWGIRTRAFAVTPGYDGVVRLAFAGAVGKALRPGGRIYWLDEKGEQILFQDALGQQSPLTSTLRPPYVAPKSGEATAWTRVRVPDNARQALIEFKSDNPDLKEGQTVSITRCAYYEHARGVPHELDDLEPPALKLLTESPNADFRAPLRFRVDDATGVNENTLKVWIDGRETPLAALAREDGAFVYRAAAPWQEGTVHEIAIVADDLRGNHGADCGFVAFTAQPTKHPKWSVRDDGMPLKDGQAFFPFGWCRIRPCAGNGFDMDRGVREMMENGLNTGHTYMSRRDGPFVSSLLDELADICERRELLLYVEPTYRNPDAAGFLPLAEKSLFAGRARKLSFIWGIGDDTSMHVTPEQLRRYHRVCKAVDPDALTASADVVGGPGLYEPFLPYFDIIAVETYPLGYLQPQNRDMAKTAADIDGAWVDVRAAGIPNRSVMALPQCFKGWRSWKRQPTIEEIRAQAYINAACRARGIIFYASTGQKFHLREPGTNVVMSATCPLDIPELKEQFFAFSREFAKLLPSLAGRDAARQPVVKVVRGDVKNVLGGASIRCLLKEDGLLIAANTAHREVAAEIQLPNGEKIEHVFPRYGYLVKR